jgi:uncharacterized membrane protein YhhN
VLTRLTRVVRNKPQSRTAKLLLGTFAAVGAVDVALAAVDPEMSARWATKPLLMPLLAAYVWKSTSKSKERNLLLGALAGGFTGDVGLLTGNDTLFMAGMGGFAAGHLCYLKLFKDAGAFDGMRKRIPAGYAAAWAASMGLLWTGLPGDLKGPLVGYSLLLTTMAAAATGVDRRTAVGGAAFLVSDMVIALDLAGRDLVPDQGAAIMPLYVLAQLMIVQHWLKTEEGMAVPAEPELSGHMSVNGHSAGA